MTLVPTDLKVNQFVWVSSAFRGKHGPGPKLCPIIKIGRLLVTIDVGQGQFPQPVKFRLDTQKIDDEYGDQYFRTAAQKSEADRSVACTAYLNGVGITLTSQCQLNGEDQERLVRLLREWGYQ